MPLSPVGHPFHQDGIAHHGHDREDGGEGDQAEAVDQGVASANGGGQADAQGGDQRHRDDIGGDPAGVVGEPDDLLGGEEGHHHHGDVARDHVPVDGVAQDHPQHPQGHHQAHGGGHDQAQGEGVDAPLADLVGLLGHGDQGGFGHHRREADGEAEGHQQRHGAAPRELVGEALAHREDAELQALQEERHPDGHDQ
mgnify:CR=1 FL=1